MNQGVKIKQVKDSAVGLRKMDDGRKNCRAPRVMKVERGMVLRPEVLQRLLPDVAVVVKGAMQSAGPCKELPAPPPPNQATSEQKPTLQTNKKPAKLKTEPPNSDSRKRWNMFPCNFCSQRFPSRLTLNAHRLTHDVFIVNKLSPRTLGSKKHMNFHNTTRLNCKHPRITQGIDRRKNAVHAQFYCNICKKLFSSRAELNAHKKQHASPTDFLPKYPCPICSEKFEDTFALASHVRTHGAPVKSYSARKQKSSYAINTTEAPSNENIGQEDKADIPAETCTQSKIPKQTGIAANYTTHNNENLMPETVIVKEESIERCCDDNVTNEAAQMDHGIQAEHETKEDATMALDPVIQQDRDVASVVPSQKKTELTGDGNLTANNNANMMAHNMILKEEFEDNVNANPEATQVSLHVKYETEEQLVLGLVLLESGDVSEEQNQEKPDMTKDVRSTSNNYENMMPDNVTVEEEPTERYNKDVSLEAARVDMYAEHDTKDELVIEHNNVNVMTDTLTLQEASEESSYDEGMSIQAAWKSLYAEHEAKDELIGPVFLQRHDGGYTVQSKKGTGLTNAVDSAANKENEPNTVSVKEELEGIDFGENVREESSDNLFNDIVEEQEIGIDKVIPETKDGVLRPGILQPRAIDSTVQIKKETETELAGALDDPLVHCENEQITEVHSEYEQDRVNVEQELEGFSENVSGNPEDNEIVKEELHNHKLRCDKLAQEAARVGLYVEHHIKDELVLGPVLLQRPVVTVAVVIPNEKLDPGTEDSPLARHSCYYGNRFGDRERGYNEDEKEGPKERGLVEGLRSEELNMDHEVKVELALGPEPVDLDDASAAILSGSTYESESLLLQNKNKYSVKMSTHTENEHIFYKKNIETHLKSNTVTNLFKCTHCYYKTSLKNRLRYHLIKHLKPLKCSHCDFTSRYKKLCQHLMLHTGDKSFKCSYCDYKCRRETSLIVHQRRHTCEKPFKCNLCAYTFPCKDQLHEHQTKYCCKKPKRFKCSYCDYSTTNKQYLRQHQTKHTGEKSFKCKHCNFRCRFISHFRSHYKTHGVKSLKCNQCDYTGLSNSYLEQHKRMHTGEKPYKCHLCSYASNHKGNLVRHVKNHLSLK